MEKFNSEAHAIQWLKSHYESFAINKEDRLIKLGAEKISQPHDYTISILNSDCREFLDNKGWNVFAAPKLKYIPIGKLVHKRKFSEPIVDMNPNGYVTMNYSYSPDDVITNN